MPAVNQADLQLSQDHEIQLLYDRHDPDLSATRLETRETERETWSAYLRQQLGSRIILLAHLVQHENRGGTQELAT